LTETSVIQNRVAGIC